MTPQSTQTPMVSPQSPLPIHPIEPSDVPILEKQTDLRFNMTEMRTDAENSPRSPILSSTGPILDIVASANIDDTSQSDLSIDDCVKDFAAEGDVADVKSIQDNDVYNMTFDSDDERITDRQEQSQVVTQKAIDALITVPESKQDLSMSIEQPIEQPIEQLTETQNLQLSPPSVSSADNAINPKEGMPFVSLPESIPNQSIPSANSAEGEIDIQQLLDNITANAESKASAASTSTSVFSPTTSLPAHASLPPRPQITQPPAHPPFSPQDDRKYSINNLGQAANNAYRTGSSISADVAPGTFVEGRNGLLPPPPAAFAGNPLPALPPNGHKTFAQNQGQTSGNQLTKQAVGAEEHTEDDKPWGPQVQKLYDAFLVAERGYVTEGAWDKFPTGSRLFIGNLPSEKVTKRDLFHIFHKYGRLAQVSIKQAYGFVQYHDAACCHRALQTEQGQEVRGRKMHLEISKAQRNTRNAQSNNPRISRSPVDHSRGVQNGRGARAGTGDRYSARSGQRDDYARQQRVRDDYRPGRSPSPRGSYRGREDYAINRGRDYYDARDRQRSRSRSPPYGFREQARYRERSPSPRAREAMEDADLQIPRRAPHDVPDVQILLVDELDRNFVSWVENELRGRGIKSEVLFISPRLPLQAVIRRQILEGVHAVSLLNLRSQSMSKIPLQVFDRQAGADNVRFDEYQDLDPKIAAELVLRTKHTQNQYPPHFTQAQFAHSQIIQPSPQAVLAAPSAPDLANLVGSLDNAALQRLLGSLNTTSQQQHKASAPAVNAGIDLTGILGGMRGHAPQQAYPPQVSQYGHQPSAPFYTSAVMQQGPPHQSAQQVQDIMAQLARFRQ